MLAADDTVRALATAELSEARFPRRPWGRCRDLRGIGAELLVAIATADALWLAHAGANEARLLRGGRVRRLVLPDTLAKSAEYRRGDLPRHDGADFVILRVIGFSEPRATVTRTGLRSGDRLVIGGLDLGEAIDHGALLAAEAKDIGDLASNLRVVLEAQPHWGPVTLVAVQIADE